MYIDCALFNINASTPDSVQKLASSCIKFLSRLTNSNSKVWVLDGRVVNQINRAIKERFKFLE